MYYEHFGLNQPPFKITPNTDFFFGGGNRGPILEALIYAITQGEGIVKVTGEVGSGKTMLCSMLQTRLPKHVETVYLANPSVSPEEILHAIAFELQIEVARDAGRLAATHAIQHHLLARHAEGQRVVLFVEESQSMPIATLEEIRLLSNLETKSDKLLQIVLFGQPELDDNLRQPQIRQLKERISHSFRLEPFSAPDTREYLMFRLRTAGYRGPDLFSQRIIRDITRISGGLSRRINLIADKALLAAFSENTHAIRAKHLAAAVRDSEFAQDHRPSARRWSLALTVLLLILGMAVGAVLYARLAPDGGVPLAHWGASLATPATPQTRQEVQLDTPSAPAPAAPRMQSPTPAEQAPTEPDDKTINSINSNSYDNSAAAIRTVTAAMAPTPKVVATAAIAAAAAPATPATPGAGERAAPVAAANSAAAVTEPAQPADAGVAPAAKNPRLAGTLLQSRLDATVKWLNEAAPQTLVIQLLGTPDEIGLNQHLKFLTKTIEIDRLFVYRTSAKGEPSLTVVWGGFDNRRAAMKAMAELPSFLQEFRPLLRTVQGIKEEVSILSAS